MNFKINLHRIVTVAGLAAVVGAYQNCAGSFRGVGSDAGAVDGASSAAPAPAPVPVPRQFAYWGSAVDGVNADAAGEYIDEVADRSNVVFVNGIDSGTGDVSLTRVKTKIEKARRQNLKVVLVVQTTFFAWATVKVLPAGNARFDALWADLGDLRSSVVAFYVYDEPYGNNAHFEPANQLKPSEVRDNLDQVADHLRAVAPGIPSVVVFGAEEIGYPDFYRDHNPTHVSWIGFDCYRFEGARCSEPSVREHFRKFSDLAAAADQGLVVLPDAFSNVALSDADQFATVARLRVYQELVASSPRVKAIYPWLFQDHVVDGNLRYRGARNLPHVKNELKIYFDALNGRAHCDANRDLVYTNGQSWPAAPACVGRCRNGAYEYRDADGTFQRTGPTTPACT